MIEATGVALRRRDAVWAANAFLLAAQIAIDDHRMQEAVTLVRRASCSPVDLRSTPSQRAAVLDRIVRHGQIVAAGA